MPTASLSPPDRAFLDLVWRAAFSNPFGDDRGRLDREIAGVDGAGRGGGEGEAAHRRVVEFLGGLRAAGRDSLRGYAVPDREKLEIAHLFDVYHGVIDQFDALIRQQLREGDATCAVPFAGGVLQDLRRRGFADAEASRYFAMFYQLRRAYYFIATSLIGDCPAMRRLRCALWANVFTMDMATYNRHLWDRMEDFSTLLLGETGTGKGAAAAAIGRSGFVPFDVSRGCFAESFARSFVPINLSQFPESLIESELFGHRKGAFTGAVEAHEGVFARCSPHGAIFLDEIGDVAVPVQIKLLRVLQERTFSPVGSHERRRFQGRVIAASNKPLGHLRQQGMFRDDFYYRLCSDAIVVPTLRLRIRESPGELADLAASVVARIVGEASPTLTADVCAVFARDLGPDYAWPGNVRELEQRIRQVLLRHACDPGEPAADSRLAALVKSLDAGTMTAQNLVEQYCALLHERHGTYEEVSRRTGLDRRTAKKYAAAGGATGLRRAGS